MTTQQNIPFIDLPSQQKRIRESLRRRIDAVLDHGQYIMGPEIVELEKQLAAYTGSKHCLAMSNGTEALFIAMMALGIGPGDEVITTPFTFVATAEMIALLGAKPVFVDIDPRTYNIDPAKIVDAITEKTKAIMPVSLYGQCADMDEINKIALEYDLPVIEDAAQSFGASYKGRKSCALSTIGCTSFFPSKPLGCYGDGGACFTDDDELAKKMDQIRLHGQDRRYHHVCIGVNGRLDTLQAAVLLAKMELFAEEVTLRESIGAAYIAKLQAVKGATPPYIAPDRTSVYAQFTVLVDKRDSVQQKLTAAGIPTAVHYPIPLHLQPAYSYLQLSTGAFPLAEQAAERVLSLPMSPYLTTDQMDRIIQALAEAVRGG